MLRTGVLAEISDCKKETDIKGDIVIVVKGQLNPDNYFQEPAIAERISAQESQQYLIKSISNSGRKFLLIAGGDSMGLH